MGVTGKLEVEVDITATGVPGEIFHELFGSKPHHISTIVPDTIHGCELHEGDFGHIGSVLEWEYTLDGKKCIAKEVVEAIDEENKMVRFKVIEGEEILKDFKSMTITLHVIPKGDYDAIKWCIDFERYGDFGLYPTNLMELAIKVTRDVEAHHVNA